MKSLVFLPLLLILNFNSIGQSNKHVVLEEFSTAPCGSCPDGAVIANELLEKHGNLIVLTHHAGFGVDSMTIPESIELAAYTNAAPTAAINRKMYDDETVYLNASGMVWSRQRWDSVVTSNLAMEAPLKVDLQHEYDPLTRTLTAAMDIIFLEEIDASLLHFNFVIVEDSVIGIGPGYDQTNYYNNVGSHPMFQRGDPIVGYEHRHVVREMSGGTWGISVIQPTGGFIIDEIYSVSQSIVLDPNWDEKQISIVGWLNYYDEDDRSKHEILNADEQKLVIPEVLSTDNLGIMNFKIFPNPTSDLITINLSDASEEIIGYKIMNQMGQTVLEADELLLGKSETLDVSTLQNGIFHLSLFTKDGYSGTASFIKL